MTTKKAERQTVSATLAIPLSTKKKFLVSMSEDDFRDRVVHPLFIERGMEHGKDVCGPDEQGKDCYFWSQHPVVGRTLTVVQTKRGKLNMSRKPRENVEEAATQLRTAISTQVSDPASGTDMYPSSGILVASGEINTAARSHITSKVSDGRISFLDVDNLIPMIDDVMPEFWNGIDADKLPYLKTLRLELLEQSETIDVSEIGINAGTPSPITDDTFVQLYLHRYKSKMKKFRHKRSKELKMEEIKVQELLDKKDSLYLLTGEAGAGKTTSLRRMAIISIDKALESPRSPIPVFLSAETIAHDDKTLVEIASEITRKKSPEKTAAFATDDLEAGKVVFLLDGLDEMAKDEERAVALRKIWLAHQKYPKCKMIVASRDHPFIRKAVEEFPYVHYHITPLSFSQAESMIQRISTGKSLSKNDTQEMLRRLENVHGLQLNPLLVTIFVATSDYARADIPANITELFKKFTELMLGRWHKSKGVGQQFHQPLKDFILKRIAFRMHRERQVSMLLSEFKAAIERELTDRGHKTDFETLFVEIAYLSGLLRIEGEEIMFRHLMLQEFFAGRGIESQDFLPSVISDSWWTKALIFYFGEHPDDKHALELIRSQIKELLGGENFQATVAVGLALQACYLVRLEDKKSFLRWVVNALAAVKNSAVKEFSNGDSKYELLPFMEYVIFGRDGVAAKIISEVTEEVRGKVVQDSDVSDLHETELFWCIVGLLESRQLEKALELVTSFNPEDSRLLLGIHLGAFYVKEIQIADPDDKRIASRICDIVSPKIEYMREQVMKEMKGMLLEVQEGHLEVLDSQDSETA